MRFLLATVCCAALTASALAGPSALSSDALSVAEPSQTELENLFTEWMRKYDKVYNHEEFRGRFQQFKDNVAAIREHNLKGTHSYTIGLNQFADLSAAEFKKKYFASPCSKNEAAGANKNNRLKSLRSRTVPASIDWRTQGAVSPVQDMSVVDEAWAFAAGGAIEGAWVTQGHHSLTEVSAEYLSDCCTNPMNSVDAGFQCVIAAGGACSTYAGDCNTCTKDVRISAFQDIKSGDENGLLQAVGGIGPVAVGIEADGLGFQLYTGGVFSGSCGTQIDHEVLVVGYGTDGTQDYWIVKNSWGASWGEQGYIRMIRNKNECGIALMASYPTV